MTQYLDSSALAKLFVADPDSEAARQLMTADPVWVTARHTYVEVRRVLVRALAGRDAVAARTAFEQFWPHVSVVELNVDVCRRAAEIAEKHAARTLDALHLAAADAVLTSSSRFHTYDGRQAAVARALGWTVVGA